MTRAEAYAAAEADHARAVGTVIETDWLYGYRGNDSVDLNCVPAIKVRVLPTSIDDLHHQVDSWLDPYWDVEPVDATVDLRSCWIFGPEYQIQEGGSK